MAYLNRLGGLSKEFGHVKVGNDADAKYEPAVYIINETAERFKGQAFVIPLSCLWKYCEPWWTMAADEIDLKQMVETTKQIMLERQVLQQGLLYPGKFEANNRKLASLAFCAALHQSDKILRMTGFNLAMCMQMFEIEPTPQAAAQLLIFIQNGLDQLRMMPMEIPEAEWQIGTGRFKENGVPMESVPITFSESDLCS